MSLKCAKIKTHYAVKREPLLPRAEATGFCKHLAFLTGIRVVANAGGINPEGCAAALRKALGESAAGVKIAVITGDNLIEVG